MAQICCNCKKSIGFFGVTNEIIIGSGRLLCDACYSGFGIYVNMLRGRTEIEGLVEAHTKAIEAVNGSKLTPQIRQQAIDDIEALYEKRCQDLQTEKEKTAKAERERMAIAKREEEIARAYRERYITHAEIVGTRMAENGAMGYTVNSTSYSVLVYYSNGDVEIHEGNADSLKPFLPFIKPKNDSAELVSAINHLEKTMKDFMAYMENKMDNPQVKHSR